MPATPATLWETIRNWFERQAQMRALERLDDRTLYDIGLTRSEIGSAVHEARGEAPETRRVFARRAGVPVAANGATTGEVAGERRHAA